MSRFTELLIPVVLIGSIWLALLTGIIPLVSDETWWKCVLPFPVYAGIIFGIYAVISIAHGVLSVKDDKLALDSLMQDIQMAREGLKKKGFRFES